MVHGPAMLNQKRLEISACMPIVFLLFAAFTASAQSQTDAQLAQRKAEESLNFQSRDPWTPCMSLNADAASSTASGSGFPASLRKDGKPVTSLGDIRALRQRGAREYSRNKYPKSGRGIELIYLPAKA
jgi:hypothetical protein